VGNFTKNPQTTTTSTTPAAPAYNQYNQLLSQAAQVAGQPYQAYSGELVAPINAQQQTGIAGINANANYASPSIASALGYMQSAANPLTAGQINQYYSPYNQEVVQATEGQFANTNATQQQQLLSGLASQGALGGSGTARAQALLSGQQQLSEAPTIAGLENTGYNQAVQYAMNQFQQNPEQAAFGIASTGVAGQNAALTGANAQFGAGTAEQQTSQALDTALQQAFYQQEFYPEAITGWEGALDTGVGSQMGGTSTTSAPPPSLASELAGIGTFGVGLGSLFSTPGNGGSSAATGIGNALGSLFTLSDKRAKKNISKIGMLKDGQGIYRFQYRDGDPDEWFIGLLAQDVEKHHPEAVAESGDVKFVNVKNATDVAARMRAWGGRVGYDVGGGVSPYFASPYFGNTQMTRGSGAPRPPAAPQQPNAQQMIQNAASMAKNLNGGSNNNTQPANVGLNTQGQFVSGPGVNTGYSIYNNGQPGGILGIAPFDTNPTFSRGPNLDANSSDYGVYYRGGKVRAGLGLASFVPQRSRGGIAPLADGGTPTFDDRFDAIDDQTSPSMASADAYMANPQASPAGAGLISGIGTNLPPDTASAGLYTASPASYVAAPQAAAPQAANVAPSSDIRVARSPNLLESTEAQYSLPSGYLGRTAQIESGNNPGAYNELSHAAGLFQFTPSTAQQYGLNDPYDVHAATDAAGRLAYDNREELRRALGREPTAAELYLAHQQGARGAIGLLTRPDVSAASVIGDRAVTANGGSRNMTAGDFADMWTDRFDSGGAATRALSYAPENQAPVAGVGTPAVSDTSASSPAPEKRGLFSQDVSVGLMAAGLGMLAGRSPYAGVNIGQGGLQGLATYSELQHQRTTQAKEQAEIDLKVKQLAQAGKFHQDEIAKDAEHFNSLSAAQKAELRFKEEAQQRLESQPVKIGSDMFGDVYAVRDPCRAAIVGLTRPAWARRSKVLALHRRPLLALRPRSLGRRISRDLFKSARPSIRTAYRRLANFRTKERTTKCIPKPWTVSIRAMRQKWLLLPKAVRPSSRLRATTITTEK
jgi:hypothetical protein